MSTLSLQNTLVQSIFRGMFATSPPHEKLHRPSEGLVPNPKLRFMDQCREVMRFNRLALRTEQAYCDWIKRFISFHGKRHPREMGAAEVAAFLGHLATERDVAAATQNQALNGLAFLFLYAEVLHGCCAGRGCGR
jgi:hypothetical protein